MRRFTFLAASLATAFMLSSAAEAAQITCESAKDSLGSIEGLSLRFPPGSPPLTPNSCVRIHVEGQIVKGDYQVFRTLLKRAEPHASDVTLISPGGDVAESMKIGELIRERMLSTKAADRTQHGTYELKTVGPSAQWVYRCRGSQCVCASACFLIWSAGIARDGDALVVHRPRDISGAFGTKTAAQASHEYSKLLDYMTSYLVRMEVPSRFIDLMVKTPSNASLLLPKAEIEESLNGYPPTIAEWLITDCGLFTLEEIAYVNLLAEMFDQLSDNDKRYVYAAGETLVCQQRKIFKERVRLSRESPL